MIFPQLERFGSQGSDAPRLAKLAPCTLPSLDQDRLPKADFIGPIKPLSSAQTEINDQQAH